MATVKLIGTWLLSQTIEDANGNGLRDDPSGFVRPDSIAQLVKFNMDGTGFFVVAKNGGTEEQSFRWTTNRTNTGFEIIGPFAQTGNEVFINDQVTIEKLTDVELVTKEEPFPGRSATRRWLSFIRR